MKTFETVALVNALMIVESLPEGQTRTGSLLYEDLMHHAPREAYDLAYARVTNRHEFFALMQEILRRAHKEQWRPILHLEIHGKRGVGLELASGDVVRWDELADACRRLVDATDNNLVVVMAVCHGYEAITDVTMAKVTPFTVLFGPLDTVTSGQIQESTGEFYRALFATSDFNAASAKLEGGYRRYDCEKIFVGAFTKYVVDECSGPRRQERLEAVLTEVRRLDPTRPLGPMRKRARELLKPSTREFELFRARFLLSDRPTNADRFTFGFDDAMEVAKAMRKVKK